MPRHARPDTNCTWLSTLGSDTRTRIHTGGELHHTDAVQEQGARAARQGASVFYTTCNVRCTLVCTRVYARGVCRLPRQASRSDRHNLASAGTRQSVSLTQHVSHNWVNLVIGVLYTCRCVSSHTVHINSHEKCWLLMMWIRVH